MASVEGSAEAVASSMTSTLGLRIATLPQPKLTLCGAGVAPFPRFVSSPWASDQQAVQAQILQISRSCPSISRSRRRLSPTVPNRKVS